jgi:hypothetical protein
MQTAVIISRFDPVNLVHRKKNVLFPALVQIAFYRFSACHLLWSILQNARKNTISPTFISQPEAQFSLFAPEPAQEVSGNLQGRSIR